MWEKIGTSIDGLYEIVPFFCNDIRGDFAKLFEKGTYANLGLPNEVTETFVSRSNPGVVRGLHFQYRNPQTKYVSAISGRIYDVAVDLRCGSPTFGQWYGTELNEANHKIFYIPAGFAHGFQVLGEKSAVVLYQCCGQYDKGSDSGIRWDDQNISIKWPNMSKPIVSDRDRALMTFIEFVKEHTGL